MAVLKINLLNKHSLRLSPPEKFSFQKNLQMSLTKFRKHLALVLVAAALLFSAINFASSFDQTFGEESRFAESESDDFHDNFTFLVPSQISLSLQEIFFAVFCFGFYFLISPKRKLSALPRSPPRAS